MITIQFQRLAQVSFAICFVISLSSCQGRGQNPKGENAKLGSSNGFIAKNGKPVSLGSPIVFGVEQGVPEDFANSCVRAAKTLNTVLGKNLLQLSFDGKNITPGFLIRINGSKKMTAATEHQASTDLVIRQVTIVGAEVFLITGQFIYKDSPDAQSVDNESVCLHELGHSLGLDHSTDKESFMYSALANGQVRRSPSPRDVQNLKAVY